MKIIELARQGLPLKEVKIIDCHCHMGDWQHFNVPGGSAEGMLESMDALGTDMACVTAHSAIGPDYIHGNNMVMDAVRKYPDRFLGYITINPNYPEDIKKELTRGFELEGMIGVKLHPGTHDRPIDHPGYHIAYEVANTKKCAMLIHVWGKGAVRAVGKIAEQYPDISLILGHGGADIEGMEAAAEVVGNNQNVYVDIAISRVREGNVEWLVKNMGSDKVLYGTDMPFFDPRPAFGRLAFAELSEDEKKNIFGLNMERIIERSRAIRK